MDEGINIMTQLVLEICGGEVSEEVTFGKRKFERKLVDYDYNKVNKLGISYISSFNISIKF